MMCVEWFSKFKVKSTSCREQNPIRQVIGSTSCSSGETPADHGDGGQGNQRCCLGLGYERGAREGKGGREVGAFVPCDTVVGGSWNFGEVMS